MDINPFRNQKTHQGLAFLGPNIKKEPSLNVIGYFLKNAN